MTSKQKLDYDLSDIHSNCIDIKNRFIYLHGSPSEEDDSIDSRVSNRFIKNLNTLAYSSPDPITVFLSSPGGMCCFGLGIYDSIFYCQNRVSMIGNGLVASMGTVVLQAADCRILYPNTEFLVHDIFSSVWGKRLEVRSQVNETERIFEKILSAYARKMTLAGELAGKSEEYIKKFIRNKLKNNPEWYMNAEEAVHYGFADGIYGSNEYPDLKSIKNGV
jgi:ATP-dependent Clp protease protease subunit